MGTGQNIVNRQAFIDDISQSLGTCLRGKCQTAFFMSCTFCIISREKPVVPFIKATQDRVVLEIQRGCIRGCRFCQAGMIYRPNREKGVKRLKELAQTMLASTGYEEISLSSLSSSDYSDLEELINFLIEECDKKHVNISLPSLRIDAFSRFGR